MEALPRLPMLSFDLKHSPEYVEFGPVLKQYIKDHYGEDQNNYSKACTDLEQLRQTAVQVSRDYMGCTTLKKYYTQLEYLQKRFPMGEGGEAAIAFTWEDVQTGRDHVISDIKFEQACVLYNIGSLHSLLGVLDTRHNVEGMRVSCTHFQCAAWVFEFLRDNFSTSTMSTDMSYEILSFHIILLLAQAQECILEKSLVDNRKSNITAKVAAQVVEFYKDASRLIDLADQKQQISSRMHKEWGRRLLMKAAFYQSVTFYCLGRHSQELEKPGECLAYYTAARDELARATQLAKNEVPEVLECLQFAKDVVMGKYEAAKKDNDFVYHDKVPTIESLPEIKGASLAKGIPVNLTDKEISGPDIFQKLVPMEAHEASSVYSEEKAKLSRTLVSEIEQKNMELEQFMSSLQLDVEQLNPKRDLIPENLMEKCAAMSVRTNAIKELTDSMTNVSGLATEVELGLEEIQETIQQDTEKTDQFEKLYGKKNPSSVLPGLLEDLAGYKKKHEEGNQLNLTLHKAMSTHTNNLKTLVLDLSDIQAMLPPSHPTLSNEDQEVINEIRRLLQKVSEMKEQRKALLEQFRDKIQKDDITNVLVTQEKKDKEFVFAEQLKKHDQLVGYIRQNLTSQDNILRHITDINAKYALIRQAFNDAHARREKVIQELIMSYDKYEELLGKSEKGAEYYKKLLENINKTLERTRSECKVRQEERDMLMEKMAPKVPPPSRPTAPKPDLSNAGTPILTPETPGFPTGDDLSSLPTIPGQVLPSGQFQNIPARFEGPKLKDYLPFMKPRSFGAKAGTTQNIPLPAAVIPDVAQFNAGDMTQRYPGLDPSLAAVLPATIAQYLASVSAAGTSMAGGGRFSPSQSSPQHSPYATPPRHSPSPLHTPPPSPAMVPVAHPSGYQPPLGQFLTSRHTTPMVADPHLPQQPSPQSLDTNSQQNMPTVGATHPQSKPPLQTPSSFSHASQFNQGPAGAGVIQQHQQPHEQYGNVPGQPPQHANIFKHDSTSTVSAVSRPIISPGQETLSQAQNFQPHPTEGQQYPQQWTPQIPRQQQQQASHSLPEQHSLPAGQQYQVPGNISSAQHYYKPTMIPNSGQFPQSQQFPTPPLWPQSSIPSTYVSMSVGQNTPSIAASSSSQPSHKTALIGQQTQFHPEQPTSSIGQTSVGVPQSYGSILPNSGPQGARFSGSLSQDVHNFGTKVMGTDVDSFSSGGNYQIGVVPSSSHGEVNQPYMTPSPHQSPKRNNISSIPQDCTPMTSVGYYYPKGQNHGSFVSNSAYPNQHLYQNVGAALYQPNQGYSSGYQQGVDGSYQSVQSFGAFTTNSSYYGQSNQAISVQSNNVSAQMTSTYGQGGSLSSHSSQPQVVQGQGQIGQPQVQSQIGQPQVQGQFKQPQVVQGQGQIGQTQGQGQIGQPHVQGQIGQPQVVPGPGQIGQPQVQCQIGQLQVQGQIGQTHVQGQIGQPQVVLGQGQIAGHQSQVHMRGPLVQGQTIGPQMTHPQVPAQVVGPQMTHPQVQGQIPPGDYLQSKTTGQQGQGLGSQTQGHLIGHQVHGQMIGSQIQGQVMGHQIQGQMTGPQIQGQMTGSQILGQMTGPHIQGNVTGPQIPGQSLPQFSGQGHQIQGQVPQHLQGPHIQGQQAHAQGQFQGHITGGHEVKGQFPSQVNQAQTLPGQVAPHHGQQPPLSGQLQFQQFPQQAQAQVFHQQPNVVHQQSYQQQHQMQQQLQQQQQQQLVGPYSPQQQMSVHGGTHQVPAGVQSALSANIANMKTPLQPTTVSGVVRPAVPAQVLSRPSTPSSHIPAGNSVTTSSPVSSKKLFSKQSSSLDDILSSSPNGVNDTIITPQVLTDQERQLQKEEALKNQAIVQTSDPYASQAALHKLLADVEAFGKFVDELSVTILGVSRLDTVWKSLLDSQDAAVKKQPMAIARCYPMKNREPDIMPYDDTRVTLTTTKDDYINASWLNDLAPSCPKFITTQAPMPLTIGEFWAMVYEQGSEVLVQITSEYETGKKYPVYYPVEKDKTLEQGAMLLSLQSVKFRQHWVERIIYLKNTQTKQARTLVHLQYKNWPVSGFPDEISSIVHFISEVHNFYMQQRSLTKPVIVHCGFGIGRTGVFTLVYTAMQEILHGNGLVDVPGLARRMLQKRKSILHKKEQLKCCYDAVLCFAEEYLYKRGILVRNPHFSPKHKVSPKHQTQPVSDDIVLGSVDLQTIQQNVGRLRVQSEAEKKEEMSTVIDQNFSKKSLESLSSLSNSSLPDVVQQYTDVHINEQDKESRRGSETNIFGNLSPLNSQPTLLGTQHFSSNDDPNMGPAKSSLIEVLTLDTSHPGSQSVPTTNVPISLTELQDPATFTLGSPDSKKKGKITKANFHQSKGSLSTSTSADPGDPLGNLDPLWTLTKK